MGFEPMTMQNTGILVFWKVMGSTLLGSENSFDLTTFLRYSHLSLSKSPTIYHSNILFESIWGMFFLLQHVQDLSLYSLDTK